MSRRVRIRTPALAVFVLTEAVRGLHDIIKEHVSDKDALEEADKYVDSAREAIEYLMERLDFKAAERSYGGYGYAGRGGERSWRSGGWRRRF